MKRLIMFIVVAVSAVCRLSAQQGTAYNDLFEGRIVPREQMVETRVRGKMLSQYRLSVFRSLRFTATKNQLKQIEALEEKVYQGVHSIHSEKFYRDPLRRGYYNCYIQLADNGTSHRFLCIRTDKGECGTEVLVIYMEGNVGSIAELRKILKQ